MELKVIAHIFTDMPEKFGIPRQSGLVKGLTGKIVFEPEYRIAEAIRGIEAYDYLWLLWQFQEVNREKWKPMVRPPRLGGNRRMGVFATRSPFRPNPIGLSSVKLEAVEQTENGPVLLVSGVDMRDGTPIFDIKPYLAYVDAHPDAGEGFAGDVKSYGLQVDFPEALLEQIPEEKRDTLLQLLEQDPRPSYQKDPDRVYGMAIGGYNVLFRVDDGTLFVTGLEKYKE